MVQLVVDIVVHVELFVRHSRTLTHRPLKHARLVLVEVNDMVFDDGERRTSVVCEKYVLLPHVFALDTPANLSWDPCRRVNNGGSHVD